MEPMEQIAIEQTRILEKQTKIFEEQSTFNLVIALATTILAFGILIQIILSIIREGLDVVWNSPMHFQVFFVVLLTGLLGAMVVLVCRLFQIMIKGK